MVDLLGYTRNKTFSIFSAFSLCQSDAASFLRALESVDVKHRQFIHISDFAEKFCGEWGEQFLYLWKDYHPIIFPEHYSQETKEQLHGRTEINHIYKVEASKRNILFKPSYLDISCFLMFIMSISDRENALWLYWLWYHKLKISPGIPSLCSRVREFWGSSTDIQMKNAVKYGERVQRALDLAIMKDLTVKTFQLYDWKTGGAWSLPLRKLKKHLRNVFIGPSFWKRAIPLINSAGLDVHKAMDRLKDEPLPVELERRLANDNREVPEASDTGERKEARREMRRVLRVFRSYHEMPSDENSPSFQGSNLLASVVEEVRKAISSLPKISGSTLKHPNLDLTGGGGQVHPAANDAENSAAAAPEDLDYKYRASITMPLSELIGKAQSTRSGVLAVIKAINDDITAAAEVERAAELYTQAAAEAAAAAAAAKSTRRMMTPLLSGATGALSPIAAAGAASAKHVTDGDRRGHSSQVDGSSKRNREQEENEGEVGGNDENHGFDDPNDVDNREDSDSNNSSDKLRGDGVGPEGGDGGGSYSDDDEQANGTKQQRHQNESDESSDDDDRNRRKS